LISRNKSCEERISEIPHNPAKSNMKGGNSLGDWLVHQGKWLRR
jgi:hypothetical protein